MMVMTSPNPAARFRQQAGRIPAHWGRQLPRQPWWLGALTALRRPHSSRPGIEAPAHEDENDGREAPEDGHEQCEHLPQHDALAFPDRHKAED